MAAARVALQTAIVMQTATYLMIAVVIFQVIVRRKVLHNISVTVLSNLVTQLHRIYYDNEQKSHPSN
jgi:hypothetical protein